MKQAFLFLLMAIPTFAFGENYNYIDRDNSGRLVTTSAASSKFGMAENSSQFAHFNILKGVEEEERSIDQLDEAEKLRVMTLAYHLNKARDYFVNVLKVTNLDASEKISVRYDMAREFSVGRHFAKDNSDYNNAVTQKGSNDYILSNEGVKKWNTEIWFRPAKDIETKMPAGSLNSSATTAMGSDILGIINSVVVDLSGQYAQGGSLKLNASHYEFELGMLLIVKKVVPNVLDLVFSKVPFKYNLDSAMVPEIIYHEFTHVVMSDKIPLTGSFAVAEGIANYFAMVISDRSSLADKLGAYGKNVASIDIDKHLHYRSKYETDAEEAHSPFTYNYLFKMRQMVNKQFPKIEGQKGSDVFDRIVFEARKYLDLSEDLTITKELPQALAQGIDDVIKDRKIARDVRLVIAQTANQMGM
jgi:hypothetical protein